jgi:hypothetical protein
MTKIDIALAIRLIIDAWIFPPLLVPLAHRVSTFNLRAYIVLQLRRAYRQRVQNGQFLCLLGRSKAGARPMLRLVASALRSPCVPQVRRILGRRDAGIDRFGHFAGLTASSD